MVARRLPMREFQSWNISDEVRDWLKANFDPSHYLIDDDTWIKSQCRVVFYGPDAAKNATLFKMFWGSFGYDPPA